LDNAGICAFHRKVARQLLNEGGLRLYLLTLEGREAAAFYGFRHKRRTMYYLGGFLPEFKQLNVGTIIVGYAIEQAAREGAPEFDFLRGDESYKYDWGAINRLTYRRTIYRDSKVCKAEAQARPILNRMMADNV
jgi:CelD/BcsL family acetyltransferase involved in cellulose biosynthesis